MFGIGNKEISIVALNEEESSPTGLGVITKLGAVKVGEFVDKKAEKFFTTPRKKGMVEWVPVVVKFEDEPNTPYLAAAYYDPKSTPRRIARLTNAGCYMTTLALKILTGTKLDTPEEKAFREAIRPSNDPKNARKIVFTPRK